MELLLIYRPRRDGRLSWPSWLTHSGRPTHEVVTRQPWIRRRSGKVRQLQTDVLTTEPRRQPDGGSTKFYVKFSISVFFLHAGMQDDQHQSNVQLYRQRNRSIRVHVPLTVA